MLLLIVISFAVTSLAAYYNFRKENDKYNEDRLKRKEAALMKSMKFFLEEQRDYIAADSIPNLFSAKIVEFSEVHQLSVNIYDLNGNLLISSSDRNFDDLGFDMKMDYTVLKQMSTGNERTVIDKDIGGHEFSNVKYDKRNLDSGELRRFFVVLTQSHILIFLGASFLAYFLSNYITSSLQKIGDKMHNINLSEETEPLVWNSKDEIGSLVNEYNRMVDQVKASADMLARSERESAWREMAKQVAHEIKNPLTPMKLRVQHLSRAREDGAPDFDQRLEAFTQTMIQQIDTLSNIATEFSNFAQMPKAKPQSVNLDEALRAAKALFKDTPKISFSYENQSDFDQPAVLVDKEQLQRAFNNLIKNSIQAIPVERDGHIELVLKTKDNKHLVEIRDNGSGIPEDESAKIFVPNFTTKSTGMGLGLAMVRNIVSQAGGKIWFESIPEKRTIFFIELPST
jgi:two-component system, NtrC family, nitrogen regulation sensor histidine kinase NtrY